MSTPALRTLVLDVSNRNGYSAPAGSSVWTVPAFPGFLNIVRAIPGPGGVPAHGGTLASDVHESAFAPESTALPSPT